MNRNILFGCILILGTSIMGVSYSADPHDGHRQKGHGDDPVLPAGEYSARIKAMVCDGCAPLVEKTLRKMDSIGPIHVDTKDSRIHFSVKKGKSVKWSSIQEALKKSADRMGMGADFTLSEFQAAPSKQTTHPADKILSSGYYEAKVGAIVCGGCKPLIEKTMQSVEGIGAAQVDSEAASVRFTVMAGKKVQVADLQKVLKLSADQMGMGADYSLSDLKVIKK